MRLGARAERVTLHRSTQQARSAILAPPGEIRHSRRQYARLDWFRDVRLVARLNRTPRVLVAGISRPRHRQDESAALRLTRPYLSYQFVAVLDRHSDVRHQHIG